jgi:hypothetical protein
MELSRELFAAACSLTLALAAATGRGSVQTRAERSEEIP